MATLPTNSTQSIAAVSVPGTTNVFDGWSSASAGLVVTPGDVVLVRVSFVATPANGQKGFYWSTQASGPVTALVSAGNVFNVMATTSSTTLGSQPQSRTALFTAVGSGSASFNINVGEGDLSGNGVIQSFVLIARIILFGSQARP